MPASDQKTRPWRVGRWPTDATGSLVISQNPTLQGVPVAVRRAEIQLVGDCLRQGFHFSEMSATLHDMLLPQITHLIRDYLAMCFATAAQVEDMIALVLWAPNQPGSITVLALEPDVSTDDHRVLDYVQSLEHVVAAVWIGAENEVTAEQLDQLIEKGIEAPAHNWMRMRARYVTTSLIGRVTTEIHLQGLMTNNTEVAARVPMPSDDDVDRYSYVNYDPLLNVDDYARNPVDEEEDEDEPEDEGTEDADPDAEEGNDGDEGGAAEGLEEEEDNASQ